MSAGVPMFIYTKDNVAWFDENEDIIEEYLSDWYHDNMGEDNYIGAIAGPLVKVSCVLYSRTQRHVWYGHTLSSKLMRSFVLLTLTIDDH